MRLATALLVLYLAAILLASVGRADNYGGVSPAEQARMVALIHRYFDPTGYGNMMVRCAARESGFNPRAANWAGPVFGLLQIRWPVWAHRGESELRFAARMWNPVANVRLGVLVLRRQGIAAWGGGC